MKLTHFGHACVLAEFAGQSGPTRLLLDPGAYSTGFEELRDLDAVLVTHEHQDHLDLGRLAALLEANPAARLIADPGSAARIQEAGLVHQAVVPGETLTIAGVTVEVHGGEHAVIHPKLPCVHNNCYLLAGRLFHPGDAFTVPPQPVEVLLLPTGAPWMKVSEGIDYLQAVAPAIAVPIHQAGLAQVHQQLHYQLFNAFAPAGTTVRVLEHGAVTELPA